MSLTPAWFVFWVLTVFFSPPPGKVNNLTKADAASGFGAGQVPSALQGVCDGARSYRTIKGC